MEKVRLILQSSDPTPFIAILKRSYPVDSVLRTIGQHHVFIVELHNLIAGYRLNINVVIECVEDVLIIDIMMTGGPLGMAKLFARSPYGEAKRLANKIVDYWNRHDIQGHQVKGESTI
jgi:hypothetical protein